MVGVHALIGIGEALITVAAVSFIRQTRPDLLRQPGGVAAQGSGWIALGLIVALVIAFVSPLADSDPDGLERVAEDKGFIEEAKAAPYEILPDYTVSFIENEALTTIVAGIAGVLIVAGIGYGVGRLARRDEITPAEDATS
jgi:cobalt/nickel transport system permease protein